MSAAHSLAQSAPDVDVDVVVAERDAHRNALARIREFSRQANLDSINAPQVGTAALAYVVALCGAALGE